MAAHPEPVEGSEEIVKVTKDIAAVEAEIKRVEAKIEAVEEKIDGENDPEEKKALREDKKALREDKKVLREKEKALCEKEKALREKEMFLLQRGSSGWSIEEGTKREAKRKRDLEEACYMAAKRARRDAFAEVRAILGRTGTPKTPAAAGEEQLRKCAHHITLQESGCALFDEQVPGDTEEEVMRVILPKLGTLVADELLCVGDTRNSKFIPQEGTADAGTDLNPDGVVMFAPFIETFTTTRGGQGQRPALGTELFRCIRCLIEGKKDGALTPTATGEAHMYAQHLLQHTPLLNILLVDRKNFRAQRWDHGQLASCVDGSVDGAGSEEYLRAFLLGASPDISQPAPTPTDEEVVRRALPFLQALGFKIDKKRPMLGIGGSALALRGDVRGEPVAAKLAREVHEILQQERVIYTTLQDKNLAGVAQLVGECSSPGNPGVLLVKPVGDPPTKNRATVNGVFAALTELHGAGIIHGDVRLANIVSHNDTVVLIDLGSATEIAQDKERAFLQRCGDFGMFVADVANRLTMDLKISWKTMVGEKHAAAVEAFVRNPLELGARENVLDACGV